jgi:hypothetical protein
MVLKVAFEVLTAVIMKSSLRDCNAMQLGESSTFRRNISSPSSGSKNRPSKRLRETGVKMEAIRSSETSGFLRSAGDHNPQDRTKSGF